MASTEYASQQFHFNPKTRTLTTEASALRLPPGGAPPLLKVRNQFDQKLYKFMLKAAEWAGDEIFGWRYECPTARASMLVFND
jgi:hypothetical protein